MIQIFYEHIYLIGIVSFLLGLCAMPGVIQIAKKKNFVVRPNKRTSHVGEIPNVGGIDICFSVLLTYMIFEFNELQEYQFILIGLFAIMVVGFVDDILILTPLAKLLGELFAGIALIGFADIRLTHLHGIFGIEEMGVFASYAISLFVLAAIINAVNLIDGVDGLASGLGILTSLFFAIYFYLTGELAWAILAVCIIGSLVVFFGYNISSSKHKIFMGDSGSLLLGYVITAFVFQFCEMNAYHMVDSIYQMNAAPAVAISVLAIPVIDTVRVSVTRILQKRSPFYPDKNHIHHLLLRTKMTHIQTTATILTVSLLFIGVGLLGRNWNFWLLLSADIVIYTAFVLIIRLFIKKNA